MLFFRIQTREDFRQITFLYWLKFFFVSINFSWIENYTSIIFINVKIDAFAPEFVAISPCSSFIMTLILFYYKTI